MQYVCDTNMQGWHGKMVSHKLKIASDELKSPLYNYTI